MRDENYRWGDDMADLRALDAWITREPEDFADDEDERLDDCMEGAELPSENLPCGECHACRAHADEVADSGEECTE